MKLHFEKYHGTGNDFILIDNRKNVFEPDNVSSIASMCNRHIGIGADGLILLENNMHYDFSMRYFNADGYEGSMCGNGGRCIVIFAQELGIIKDKTIFKTIDGTHQATIKKNNVVALQMNDVTEVQLYDDHSFLDTGSPHHIKIVEEVSTYPVLEKGREIRYAAPYYDTGTNVNFVEQTDKKSFKIRTYERGVEDETLSCGTGVTAVAIAMHAADITKAKAINLETLGGDLKVSFKSKRGSYTDVILEGPVKKVFSGEYVVD